MRLLSLALPLFLFACAHSAPPPATPSPCAPSAPPPAASPSNAPNETATANSPASLWDQDPVRLASFPSAYTLNRPTPQQGEPPVQLKKMEQKANKITDDEDWFRKNGLTMPEWEVPNRFRNIKGDSPADIPATYRDNMLVKAIRGEAYAIAVYGHTFAETSYVALLDAHHHPVAIYDVEDVLRPLNTVLSGVAIPAEITWGALHEGVLYLQSAHRTYASSSKGKNAYITAIDFASGEVMWQSEPLVANAQNFILRGDSIVCGYGFTAEPDFIYVLSRSTGAVTSKIPVKSGPSYLIEKDQKLFVRTYDTDYVFGISGGKP